MNDKDLSHWHARLDAREAELREEVRTVAAEQADAPSSVPMSPVGDFGEQAEEYTRGAVRHAERMRDVEELQAIDDARARLADGTFGVCVDCGMEIPRARLEAQPAAARCVACQERYEATHSGSPRAEFAPRNP